MRTIRGGISSYDNPDDALEKVARKPTKRARRPVDPAQPASGLARFVTVFRGEGRPRLKNLTLYLGMTADDDAADDARTLAAAAALKKRKLRFRDGAYTTNIPEVASWLRGRIYAGRLPAVEEDAAMLDLPCPHQGCAFTVKRTKAGDRELLQHIYDDHGEEAA